MRQPHKFGAKATVCRSAHKHPSMSEAKRCDQLVVLEESGAITHLTQQPVFPIVVNGKKICDYIADFQYRMSDSGLVVVEDVKGVLTPVFSLKRKLVEAAHAGVVISLWPPRVKKKRKAKKPA